MSTNATPQKKRWYQTIIDLYKVTKRTYSWIGPVMLGIVITLPATALIVMLLVHLSVISIVAYTIMALMIAIVIDTYLLSSLANRAVYQQLDGVKGAVYAVISNLKRGWIVETQPVAFNRKQDLIWRIVGRPGVVLIGEGPHSRIFPMLMEERTKTSRVAPKVEIHVLQCGNEPGQIPISKLLKTINRLPKSLDKNAIPILGKRLESLQGKGGPGIPKGVDPTATKMSRRALRGK